MYKDNRKIRETVGKRRYVLFLRKEWNRDSIVRIYFWLMKKTHYERSFCQNILFLQFMRWYNTGKVRISSDKKDGMRRVAISRF